MNLIKNRGFLRKIRKLRKLSGRTKFTRTLHLLSGVCGIFFFVSLLFFGNSPKVWWFFVYLLAGFSTFAFVIETKRTTAYLIKTWWNTWLGKLLYSVIALVVSLASILISKQLIHEVTGGNPIYFPESIALLSIPITIFLIMLLVQISLGVLTLVYMLKGFGLMFMDMMISSLMGANRNFMPLIVRVVSGKKEKYPRLTLGWYSMSMLFGSFTLMFILSYPGQLLARESVNLQSILAKSLVYLEYKSKAKCNGIHRNAKITYLNKSYISVAKWNEAANVYQFHVEECKY